MRTILVAGLPASGKTFYARELANQTGGVLVDDPQGLGEIFAQIDEEILVIADPHFCITETRNSATRMLRAAREVEPEWVFFANDPDQCQRNAALRPERTVREYIRFLSSLYLIPEGENQREVYRGAR